jgi:hypothetical protein
MIRADATVATAATCRCLLTMDFIIASRPDGFEVQPERGQFVRFRDAIAAVAHERTACSAVLQRAPIGAAGEGGSVRPRALENRPLLAHHPDASIV